MILYTYICIVCLYIYICTYIDTHIHIYVIFFSHEKEGNPDICNNMDRLGGHYIKRNKPWIEEFLMWTLDNREDSTFFFCSKLVSVKVHLGTYLLGTYHLGTYHLLKYLVMTYYAHVTVLGVGDRYSKDNSLSLPC